MCTATVLCLQTAASLFRIISCSVAPPGSQSVQRSASFIVIQRQSRCRGSVRTRTPSVMMHLFLCQSCSVLLLMPWFGALRGPRGGVGRSDVSLGGELSDAAGRPSVPAVIRMHSSPTRLSLSLSLRGPLVVCSSPFCLPYSPHDECCPLLPLCPPPLLPPPAPRPLT